MQHVKTFPNVGLNCKRLSEIQPHPLEDAHVANAGPMTAVQLRLLPCVRSTAPAHALLITAKCSLLLHPSIAQA